MLRIGLRADGPGLRVSSASEFPCEFHVAARVRDKYRFADSFFRSNGNVVFADFRSVREFAARMNERLGAGEAPVRAGDLNAMGLIDEILHYVFRRYETTANPGVLGRAVAAMEAGLGHLRFRTTLHRFTERFPPVPVYRGDRSAAQWLSGSSDGRPHPEVSLEELLMLRLSNANPAFARFRELFDDAPLSGETSYPELAAALRTFFRNETPFDAGGGSGGSILDVLEQPMRAHPDNLAAQLGFIRDRWGIILSDDFRRKVLSSEDLAREDQRQYPVGGAGPVGVPDYSAAAGRGFGEYPETENFTHDTEWMPNVILLAKNTYVWLHQLSREYGRTITRLDEVPDEELDRLASRNFTSLWLIGVWHRSQASERIKRMTGNPEAAPSAYSLYEYDIAPDLGGEGAFGNLAHRAWQRGIRLAADMVPNHTGIESRWMRDHPDYFMQADRPPFPSYRFTGPDLSGDPDYQVRIEDGYWTRTDAAVVFQRTDNRTGRLRYIYHGNDGTNMPWNDTAQLDFLRPDVREAVIGEILRVAKKFSVIRFDAAMTLTKKHFQRLWHPRPGTGGDIPSRADYAMTQEEFDARVPLEFWREVVDRINREMPQTLLLAEAFWLLEGYFVRTLGMHRVYNSAFMHMLMKEDNRMYRGAIRSTLHFNPEILKRYVNFMSNPDEQTAVEQFGKGDKYFGVATLMVTLPGLPMFAHGQVEGYREKYGMEYRRDYHDETPDADLVRRHEREIFPLLRMRRLFSQTEHFEFYDAAGPDGNILEDLYAFSNLAGGERTIVCFNNRYEASSGRLKMSTGKLAGGAIRYPTLGEALKLRRGERLYYLFTEQRSGLDYVRTGDELHDDGFFVRVNGYESQVYLHFREVVDHDGSWGRLHGELGGAGVRDAAKAARGIRLREFTDAFTALFDPVVIDGLVEYLTAPKPGMGAFRKELDRRMGRVTGAMPGAGVTMAAARLAERLARLRKFFLALEKYEGVSGGSFTAAAARGRETAGVLLGTFAIGALFGAPDDLDAPVGGSVFDEWMLADALEGAFGRSFPGAERNAREAELVRFLACEGAPRPAAARSADPPPAGSVARRIAALCDSRAAGRLLRLNEYRGVVYFHKESFADLLTHTLLSEAFSRGADFRFAGKGWKTALDELGREGRMILAGAERSEYRLHHFRRYLQSAEFLTLTAGTGPAPAEGT